MDSVKIFEKYAKEYDDWYDKNKFVYQSEVLALKKFIPKNRNGTEVGVGTGRFAVPLRIKIGIEPAKAMADIARKRGIEVYAAKAEELPFDDSSFDFVLMVVTLCFVQNPIQALSEAKRIIKPNGHIIISIVDKESFLGKFYESKKEENKFYRHAKFYSVEQVFNWLKELEFSHFKVCQTIFKTLDKISAVEPIKDGYGEGGFVVISAQKQVKT